MKASTEIDTKMASTTTSAPSEYDKLRRIPNIEVEANLFSKLLFSWLYPLVRLANEKEGKIDLGDICAAHPQVLAETASARLDATLHAVKARDAARHAAAVASGGDDAVPTSLYKTLYRAFSSWMWLLAALDVLKTAWYVVHCSYNLHITTQRHFVLLFFRV
jgi:hypothetical protein